MKASKLKNSTPSIVSSRQVPQPPYAQPPYAQPPYAQPPCTRSGFTLIEMMVATVMITMLMVAISSATSMYLQTATDSFEEVERSQVARALFRDLSRDIRSATFVLKDISDEEDEELDTETTDADTAMASYTDGLFGNSTDLVIYASRPDADVTYVDAQSMTGADSRSSDAMIIRYFLAESGGSGLSGMLADSAMDSVNVPDNVVGLGVMTGDMVGLSHAINVADVETQMEAARLLAPEVSGLVFTYISGTEEFSEWDSNVENAMPTAIRIEMTLRTILPEWDDRDPENTPGMLSETVHSFVVPIPVSDPFVQDMEI